MGPGGKHHKMLMVFSYLSGSWILHKAACLSKRLRKEIPEAGLLDQHKQIKFKSD